VPGLEKYDRTDLSPCEKRKLPGKMNRAIIHLNIADFAVAVESNIQSSIRGYPVVIAPQGAPRAVVYDMSDEAFHQGIRKGMPLSRAKRLNKKIKVLPPSFSRYESVMKDLLKETLTFTPFIESGAFDGHIFMDVTGSCRLFGPPVDVAFKLKKAFKKTFNFDPIWSVATNKLVAKVATRVVKPFGEYIVPPGDEKEFLSPLPLALVPGFMKTEITKLNEFNLFSISQARTLTLEQLEIPFHNRAPLIYNHIRGVDHSPVTSMRENRAAIKADHEFSNDTNDAALLRKALYLMIEKICKTLRSRKQNGAAVKIILSYSDGQQTASKLKIAPSTSNDMALFKKCLRLLDKAWTRRVRIRHMRLVCEKLVPFAIQTKLFAGVTKETKQVRLIPALDSIREKFGKSSIKSGLTLFDENRLQ